MILSKREKMRINIIAEVRGNDCDPRTGSIQSAQLASILGFPQRYLEQDLQAMVRAGLLSSVPGPSGGYTLAKPLISLLEILLVKPSKVKPQRTCGDLVEAHIRDLFKEVHV